MARRVLCALALAGCHGASSPPPRTTTDPDTRREIVDTLSIETREATRLAFDVTPDGRFIVIDLYGQIWRIPSAGGEAVPITAAIRDTAEDLDPAVSPDGRWIVFQSDRPGGRGLWLMPTAGGTPRRLTSRSVDFFTYASPSWSPDGRRIAYAVRDTLAVLEVESGAETVLRIDSLPAAFTRPGFTPRNASPAWSPDGERLVFVNTAANSVRGDGRIWEVAEAGGPARPVTTMRGVAPVWSPDGSRLAFFSRDSASRWQVWTQSKEGTTRRLTDHDEVITHRVRWTPDGRSLVYAADGGLWRVSPEGSAPVTIPFRVHLTMARRRAALRPITFPPPGSTRAAKGFLGLALSPDARRIAMIALDSLWIGDVDSAPRSLGDAREAGDSWLAWSPDGREVAWTRREGPGHSYDLILTDTRTGAHRVFVSPGQDVFAPSWSPDGKWIAIVAGGRLRLVDAAGERVARLDQTRDLGSVSPFWSSRAWSPRSDGLVVTGMGFNAVRIPARWIPLAGEPRRLPQFPVAPANLFLTSDGYAVWVEDNRLWRAHFDTSVGLRDAPVPVSDDPAVEARHALEGSTLYLSSEGLRLRAGDGTTRPLPWPLRYRVRSAPGPILIRGARIVDGRGSPLSAPSDVLLRDGRIARIAPAGTIAADGSRVIEAGGAYLLPGFIDLHGHLWDDLSLVSWLHNGVTTVRDIASQRLKTPDTRNRIEAGITEGPRVVYGGAMFHGGGAGYSTLSDQLGTDSASIARAVAILAGLDAGYVKERGFEGWWRAVQLVREAHRFGMPVSGHCGHILPVIAAGLDGVEHVLDCTRDRYSLRADYAQLARAAGLWIVPTAALRYSMVMGMHDSTLVSAPDVAPFLAPTYRPFYLADSVNRRNAQSFTVAVQRVEHAIGRYRAAGVRIATGTDSPFPLGLQHEMEVLVESGMSPMEAIVAATGDAARVLNTPEIGTIAPGQWADLVLLSENPLEDIRNTRRIREVIQGGRVVDREALRRQGLR